MRHSDVVNKVKVLKGVMSIHLGNEDLEGLLGDFRNMLVSGKLKGEPDADRMLKMFDQFTNLACLSLMGFRRWDDKDDLGVWCDIILEDGTRLEGQTCDSTLVDRWRVWVRRSNVG